MATVYDRIPTLVERIVGAHLIVIARFAGLREVRPAEGFDRPRVFGLFEVDVAEVLYGAPPDRLLVRVLSDPEDPEPDPTGEATRWVVLVDPDARVLLVLARDVAPDLPDGVYALYFASAFAVEEDWVVVPADALDEQTRRMTEVDDRGRVSIAGLRRLIETVTAELDDRRRALEVLFPPVLREHPYPPTLERPDAEVPAQPPQQPPLVPAVDGGRPAEEQQAEGIA
jgi:hypothetical protein